MAFARKTIIKYLFISLFSSIIFSVISTLVEARYSNIEPVMTLMTSELIFFILVIFPALIFPFSCILVTPIILIINKLFLRFDINNLIYRLLIITSIGIILSPV